MDSQRCYERSLLGGLAIWSALFCRVGTLPRKTISTLSWLKCRQRVSFHVPLTRAPAEPFTIVAVQTRQPRRRAGPRTSGMRPVLRGRFPKRHIPVRWDGKTGTSCPCGVLTKEEVGRYALLTDGRRSNRTLISFVMRLRFAMTARTRSTPDYTGNEQGTLAATHQRGRGRTRSSCCYARNNVGCSIRWPARRETLLHPSGARPDLVADALNPAQFVSRRSILPTGNLATLC